MKENFANLLIGNDDKEVFRGVSEVDDGCVLKYLNSTQAR